MAGGGPAAGIGIKAVPWNLPHRRGWTVLLAGPGDLGGIVSQQEPPPETEQATPAGGPPKKVKRKHGLVFRTVKWLAITGLVLFVGLVAAVVIAYRMTDIPDPNKDFQAQTSFVYYSDGEHIMGTFASQDRINVALSDVPQHVQDAVIAAEDRSFYSNSGIDPKGIIRAAWSNLHSDSTQGASTITQQYVKVLYLSQERTWTRKIREALLAVKIQREQSKTEILQGYLNTIYFGRGAYGIEAAARAFYDESAGQLSIRQGAVLASILNSPSALDPAVDKDNAGPLLERYRYVLGGMVDMGSLDPDVAARCRAAAATVPRPGGQEPARRSEGLRARTGREGAARRGNVRRGDIRRWAAHHHDRRLASPERHQGSDP